MKQRMPIIMLAVFGLLTIAGRASAVPIPVEIGGSTLSVSGLGIGDYSYADNSFAAVLLDDGQSQSFNFGHVDVPFAIAGGTVQLAIQLLSPTPDGTFASLGDFFIVAFFNFGSLDLDWDGPATTGYSYNGGTGGILSLNMDDISGGFHGGFDLTGTITNVQSPSRVPEPGVLLLLGAGLLTVATVRRRKAS